MNLRHCPYLRDGETESDLAAEPQHGRSCAAQQPAAGLSLSQQVQYCLAPAYAKCPYHRAAHGEQAVQGRFLVVWRTRKLEVTVLSLVVVVLLYAALQNTGHADLRAPWSTVSPQDAAPASASTPSIGALTLTTPTTPANSPMTTPTTRPQAHSPPTHISIPKIAVDADVVEVAATLEQADGRTVAVWRVADFAVGFHRGSAYPGNVGNTVMAAHNNIRGRVFRHLVDLAPGDDIYLYVQEQEYRYVVTERLLVKEKGEPEEIRRENAQWIEPSEDERLTLVSCWPFIKPDHRVVIIARPVY